jgi:hypothetical protein
MQHRQKSHRFATEDWSYHLLDVRVASSRLERSRTAQRKPHFALGQSAVRQPTGSEREAKTELDLEVLRRKWGRQNLGGPASHRGRLVVRAETNREAASVVHSIKQLLLVTTMCAVSLVREVEAFRKDLEVVREIVAHTRVER